jgi:hypothetical protein
MRFQYNLQTNRIESADPDVFIRLYGYLPGRELCALNYHDKQIGFFLATDPPGPNEDLVAQGVHVNLVLSLCEQITRVRDGKRFVKVPAYRFADRDEQSKLVDLMLSALSSYDGIRENVKEGSVVARLSRMAEAQMRLGVLLSK